MHLLLLVLKLVVAIVVVVVVVVAVIVIVLVAVTVYSKYKSEVKAGAMVGKYNLGPGPVNTDLAPGSVNTNWGPGPVNSSWGPRPVNNWEPGSGVRARTKGQAKGGEPGNTNTQFDTLFFILYQRS